METQDPSVITNLDRKPCGCVLTDYASGRKTFEPCVACGLMRAGYLLSMSATAWWPRSRRKHLLEAGNCLAAVATTIAKAASQKAMVDTVVDTLKQAGADEAIRQDQPEGNHSGQTGD